MNAANEATITGKLMSMEYSHVHFNEVFYTGILLCQRLSGVYDEILLSIPSKAMLGVPPYIGQTLKLHGEVRTYNKNDSNGCSHLVVMMFVKDIDYAPEAQHENRVELYGIVCRNPVYRTTPYGREICDFMICVQRTSGARSYIPLITWGDTARLSRQLAPGDSIRVTGRLQSRVYNKQLEDGTFEQRIAREVSVAVMSDVCHSPVAIGAVPHGC